MKKFAPHGRLSIQADRAMQGDRIATAVLDVQETNGRILNALSNTPWSSMRMAMVRSVAPNCGNSPNRCRRLRPADLAEPAGPRPKHRDRLPTNNRKAKLIAETVGRTSP